MSPADTPSAFIESESTRATLLPTSREYASNILSEISFWLMYLIPHAEPYTFVISIIYKVCSLTTIEQSDLIID